MEYKMEYKKNNKGLIVLFIVIISLLSIVCILLVTGTISFDSNKSNDGKNENVTDNNQSNVGNDELILKDDEKKGLEIYKYFVNNGTGPFKWKNNKVTNYDDVMSRMTESYKKTFESSDNGFSIPFKENGEWKSSGGFGSDIISIYKDIRVVSKDTCRIYYEVRYEYTKMGDAEQKLYEACDEFVVKTKPCDENDLDVDFSKGYKMDSFKLIYGMKFE